MNRTLLWILPGLLLAAGFSLLGRWQLGRAVQKEAILQASAQVLAERLPQALAKASTQDDEALAWAEGAGRFASAPVLLLDNQRRGEAVGVRVYRVFQPDHGASLLVDMGWLPLPPNRQMPLIPTPDAQPVTLRGLLAPPPATGIAMGADHSVLDTRRWLLTRIDRAALATALGQPLATRVLRLDPDLAIGYARDLDVLSNTLTPDKHRGYALQWFGLAVASVVTTFLLAFRGRTHD